MTSPHVQPVTDVSFAEAVLASPVPVLVEVGGTWCPPCRRMEPVVAELAAAWSGRVRVVSCDADANQASAARLRVHSVPTFVVLRGGVELERVVGAVPRRRLEEMLVRAAGQPSA